MYVIEALIVVLFSSKLKVWLPCNKWFANTSSVRFKILLAIFLTESKRVWRDFLKHNHKKKHSLDMRAVKVQFLLIYEIMLKSIATARSECTAKQENKASYNTYCIAPDLIDFYGNDWKEIKTQTDKRNIHKTKNWFVFSNFWELPKDHTEK